MKTSPERIQEVIDTYFEAWKSQDPERLVEVFADDAVYKVKPFGLEEYVGLEAIKGYWSAKPGNSQINPAPAVIEQAVSTDLCFVEWETNFTTPADTQKTVRGMLLLLFRDGLVTELREHYDSKEE